MEERPPTRWTDSENEMESRNSLHAHRLAGEDAPIWLSAGFTLVGTLIAIASASAWLSESPAVMAQAPEMAASPTAEQDRLGQDATRQQRPAGAQENAAASSRQAPATATIQPEREAAEVDMARSAGGAASVELTCFSAFNIPFARNSSLPITKSLEPSIERLRWWMTEHPDATLLVEGHADATGTEQYNVLLSFSRAKAVAALFSRLGIPERRMTVRAAGAKEAGGLASDRSAFLRVEGVENCNGADGATEKR